jgi:GTPase SAR1 family protein
MEKPIFDNDKALKIILSGLDNAGKSSMLVVIEKLYQFEEDLGVLLPTKMIEYYRREFLGYDINFFDMGGQEMYREIYLKREIYFAELNFLIYLIDITDIKRFEESVDYLGKILDVLDKHEYEKNREIFICFTKMDMDSAFAESPEFIVNLAKTRKLIIDKYNNFKFDFFSTSIFNTYSIVKMISKALSYDVDGYEEMRSDMEDYATKYSFDQMLLYDSTGLIIADYANSFKDVEHNSLDTIISDNLSFFKKMTDYEEDGFRRSKKIFGDLMNICYQFKVDIPNGDIEEEKNYYITIIVDNEIGKRAEWNRNEIIKRFRERLRAYYILKED